MTLSNFENLFEDYFDIIREGDLIGLHKFLDQNPTWNPNVTDPESGNTALHYASANGYCEIIEFLLSKHSIHQTLSCSESQISGQQVIFSSPKSPIHHSLRVGLLDAVNEQGNTPCHWACLNGQLQVVKILCQAGANPFIENSNGRGAVEEAASYGHDSIVEYVTGIYEEQKQEQPHQ